MIAPIRKIATVDMGYPFRSRLEMVAGGNICVIQMKDIDEKCRLNTGDLVPVSLPVVKKTHRIKMGDVIFRSRGRINTATLVDEPLAEVVAAAPLLRIRVKTDKVLPEYLAWYINRSKAQAYIESRASGTITRMINKKTVEEMEIELPPINEQKRIVAIARLAGREQELLRQLAEKRKIYTDAILMKLAVKR